MIDKELDFKLRKKFSPEGSKLRDHQKYLVKMLCDFNTICLENNIKYWLAWGTCLGAVRHGGFIPWDDDVDVAMMYDDYKRFEKIFKENDCYALQSYKTDKYYTMTYSKFRDKHSRIKEHGQDNRYKYHGVYIDIFVLRRNPKFLGRVYNIFCHKLLFWGGTMKSGSLNNTVFSILRGLLFITIKFSHAICSIIPNRPLIFELGSGDQDKVHNKKDFSKLILADFEGYQFPIPSGYDHYLTSLYGNYMELPNLNSINPHVEDVEFF